MANSKKQSKDIFFISDARVILTAVLHSLLAGIVLFIILSAIFVMKTVLNGKEILDSIEKAVVDTQMSKDSAESEVDYRYISFLNYLGFLHERAGDEYQQLVEFAEKHYPQNITFAMDSDGQILTEEPKELSEYGLDEKTVYSLIRAADGMMIIADRALIYYSNLENGDYLVMVLDNVADQLSSQVLSPLEAIQSVMSKNDIGHNDENHAYLKFRGTKDVYTENGYFTPEEAPALDVGTVFFQMQITDEETEKTVDYDVTAFVKNQIPYYSITKYNEDLNADITFYSFPFSEIHAADNIIFSVEVTYITLLIIFSLFVYYLRQYSQLHPDNTDYSPAINRRKTLIGLTIGILTVSAVSYFSQTLFLLSGNVLDDRDELAAIKSSYKSLLEQYANLEETLRSNIADQDEILADSLGNRPNLINRENLNVISSIFSLQYMIMYDLDGNEIAASNEIRNYSFPTDKEDPAYCFNTLKNGLGPVSTAVHENPLSGGSLSIRSAINVYDGDHNPIGYLESGVFPSSLNTLSDTEVLNRVLKNMMLANASRYYVVNPETEIVTYAPDIASKGFLAAELGFTPESLQPDFFGKLTLEGVPCYATNTALENQLVYMIHPDEQVYLTRIPYTIAVSVMYLLNALMMLWFLRSTRKNYQRVIYSSKQQYQAVQKTVIREKTDGNEEEPPEKRSALRERITSASVRWMYQPPEKKLSIAFEFMIELGAVVVLLAFTYRLVTNRDDSLLLRILSGRWTKGVNVFSLTANLITLLMAIVTTAFIRWCLRMIGQISDARGETVTRLLQSAVSYIAVLAVIYICLVNIGLNPNALVTSAGLVGVAIGIGARDLITDIIAGLFIIFEGSFQVGDIIDVGGYEGTVREIGIRATRVTGFDLNVKTINNRNMTNVINMSAKNQYSIFYFRVPYTVSEETLKELLINELKTYKAKYPELITVPYLSIIKEKLTGMWECRIVSQIPEISRAYVEQGLIHDTAKFLKENNIHAIFPEEKKVLITK